MLGQHVDFAALAVAVDAAAPCPSRERGGRPPFPTELMVRVPLIQQLFNLSDEQRMHIQRKLPSTPQLARRGLRNIQLFEVPVRLPQNRSEAEAGPRPARWSELTTTAE